MSASRLAREVLAFVLGVAILAVLSVGFAPTLLGEPRGSLVGGRASPVVATAPAMTQFVALAGGVAAPPTLMALVATRGVNARQGISFNGNGNTKMSVASNVLGIGGGLVAVAGIPAMIVIGKILGGDLMLLLLVAAITVAVIVATYSARRIARTAASTTLTIITWHLKGRVVRRVGWLKFWVRTVRYSILRSAFAGSP